MADQFTRQILQDVRGLGSGAGISYNLMPAITGAAAPGTGVQVTGGAAAFGTAVKITTTAITTEFWVCGMQFYTLSAFVAMVIQVGVSAASPVATVQGNWVINCTAATMNLGPFSIGPYPVYAPANTNYWYQAGGAAQTLYGHLWYAIGL